MRMLITLIMLAVFLSAVPADAGGRSIKAYFNGQEATVSGIVLHPGERFTVDLYVTPDAESIACAILEEPGVTPAYDRVSGDDKDSPVTRGCNASFGARFHWVLAANGNWAGGTAPLNIYYQINARGSPDPCVSGLFTVVDAYIAPGNRSKGEKDAAAGAINQSPAPGIIALLCIIGLSIVVRRGRTK